MKVLIVARTRQHPGACIGGISGEGRSVRLVPADPADERWGLEFQVGEVWDVETEPPPQLIPPHLETLAVRHRARVRRVADPVPFIERFMPPRAGGTEVLYDGLAQRADSGALFIAPPGVPRYSTLFWRPDRPLERIADGKRIRYRYPAPDADRSLVFVGFQDPVKEIPAGTLVRVSLAHWWRPAEHLLDEPRCFVQISGWFPWDLGAGAAATPADPERTAAPRPPSGSRLEEARRVLARVFGYPEFRPLQEELVVSVLAGHDCFGVMPTGSGKSLCYQLPALMLEGLTVVVSPLLSLMQDQVDQLRQLGIDAVALNSTLNYSQYRANQQRVRTGQAKLLYVAPETLVRPEVRLLLKESSVACLTVDEAHCISEWGHDFRPEYREIGRLRKELPDAVALALTATATPRVQEDIRASLGISPQHTYVAGFDRPNLYLEVRRREEGFAQVLDFVRARPDEAGIVYCSTRDQVDQLAAQLTAQRVQALPYHAGMDDATRAKNQRLFQHDQVPVIVATVAFGMGINKPNVRYVVHQALPGCVETYYQQIGRAGRDGLRSDCLLLFARADVGTSYHFIQQGASAERQGRMARLQAMVRYAESSRCRRLSLLGYFGDEPEVVPCGMCDNCLAEGSGRQLVDVSADARLFMTCMEQTRQRFGATHLVEVLRGSRSARILKWRHDQLSVHGEGRHRPADQWRLLADRFIELGLIEAELEHGTLRLTAEGKGRLTDEGPVLVALEEVRLVTPVIESRPRDALLFEALRAVRARLAGEAGVPPYVIFSDRTLTEMASTYPGSREALLQVHGVGEHKAGVYGEVFLEVVRRHVEEHGIEAGGGGTAPAGPELGTGRRFEVVAEQFRDGASIAELQERWGVVRATILNHLESYVRSGGALEAGRLLEECQLDDEMRERALALFEERGDELLGPVFADLHGKVDYLELRLLRLYRRCSEPPGE